MKNLILNIEEIEFKSDGTANINHENCPDGVDIRQRLNLLEVDDGILAHCFNCGGGWFVRLPRSKGSALSRASRHAIRSDSGTPGDYKFSGVTHTNIREWSRAARVWVLRYGISPKEIGEHVISYSEYFDAIVFPLKEGYVLRNFSKNRPKYLMKYNKEGDYPPLYTCTKDTSNKLFICEDILSSIKLGRYYHSMAILKSTLSERYYPFIYNYMKRFSIDKVYVYLDNDNPAVRKHARDIYSIFTQTIGISCDIIHLQKDPKELSNGELDELGT